MSSRTPEVFFTVLLVPLFANAALAETSDVPEGHPSIAEIVQGGGCAPKDNMARILRSANPLDFVANWSKNNYVGTSWTVMPKRYVVTELDGGIFLQGDLISPKGGTTDKNVFILFSEWKCGS